MVLFRSANRNKKVSRKEIKDALGIEISDSVRIKNDELS